MTGKTIDAKMMQKMFLSGAKALEAKKDYINELNVFPVPDGDTGTNMTMTIMAAAKEVGALADPTIETLGKAISSGSLRGARGNSGVILSQIFRGFIKDVKGLSELDGENICNAVRHAAHTAYKAVMKPKEGTILTVAKSGADKATEILTSGHTEDLFAICDQIMEEMDKTLQKTPDMLPVLKQAGVVDSGGEGLMTFIHGAIDALNGRVSEEAFSTNVQTVNTKLGGNSEEAADIRFGYCTEFIIMLERNQDVVEKELKAYLQGIGDCVVVVADDDIVKVHVHTNDPGLAIQKALTYGSLTNMKIDNMREEHQEKLIKDAEKVAEEQKKEDEEEKAMPHKAVGFISVSAGKGLSDIFKDLGVDYVIEGGQTMNPSTEDILDAIQKVNADTIFVLPNNGNIILAAEQAKQLTEDKDIRVIPSKNIPQGISAMINYMDGKSADENEKQMSEEMVNIKSGQVTYAVRDTVMDGKQIKQGDYMGITDKTIVAVASTITEAAKQLVDQMVDEDSELISLYYGADVTEEEAESLADELLQKDSDVEVEVQYGGQPVYSYFISVE